MKTFFISLLMICAISSTVHASPLVGKEDGSTQKCSMYDLVEAAFTPKFVSNVPDALRLSHA